MSDQQPDNGNSQGRPRPPGPPLRMSRGVFGWVVFILISLTLVMVVMQGYPEQQILRYDQFLMEMRSGNIRSVVIKEDKITGELAEVRGQGQPKEFEVGIIPGNTDLLELAQELTKYGAQVELTRSNSLVIHLLLTFVPWLLIIAFIWFFVFRQFRGVGGGPGGMLGNFGRSKHRVTSKEHTHVTFSDVAGIEEGKDECT